MFFVNLLPDKPKAELYPPINKGTFTHLLIYGNKQNETHPLVSAFALRIALGTGAKRAKANRNLIGDRQCSKIAAHRPRCDEAYLCLLF